jgi:hypothetical protein
MQSYKMGRADASHFEPDARRSIEKIMTTPITVSLRRESDDPTLNQDVLAVARDVVQTCADAIAVDPPLGRKPFVVQQASDGTPRACLNGLPSEYLINVTCLHSRLYAQLAFQLGHELGHFFVDPHYSNWFVESVCTAVSFLTLDALAAKWRMAPPFPNWRAYASSFAEYKQKTLGDALGKLGIPSEQCISTWIRTSLASVIAAGAFDRTEEMLCAHTAAGIMHAHADSLSAITRLGLSSRVHDRTDFSAWQRSVPAAEATLVAKLEATFAHGFRGLQESNKTAGGDA